MKRAIALMFVWLGVAAAQDRTILKSEINQGWFSVVIASGATASTSVRLDSACTVSGLLMPDSWTAADVGFMAGVPGQALRAMKDLYGGDIKATAA